jgi:hypothetical protein
VWQGIDDDDAVSHRVGDKAYAIAYKVRHIIFSSLCSINFELL